MQFNEQQIETMVRQVLERVHTLQGKPQLTSTSKNEQKPASPSASGTQTLESRVIGTRELESLASETKRVIVRRGTVVTPAARDWLRGKKIELAWATTNDAPIKTKKVDATGKVQNLAKASAPATRQIILGQVAAGYDATALTRQLQARGYAVQRLAHAGMEAVTRELASAAAFDGMPAVLLTDQPWVAVVAANRHANARAAWVRDRRETVAALREIKANVLIVNVAGQSVFGVLNTILPFVERS